MFLQLDLCDPGTVGRPINLAWWPKQEVEERCERSQVHLIQDPWSLGLVQHDPNSCYPTLSAGALKTLEALWTKQGNLCNQFNILKAGILRTLLREEADVAAKLSTEELRSIRKRIWMQGELASAIWTTSDSEVLPGPLPFLRGLRPVESSSQLMQTLDELASQLLDAWQPVAVTYSP